jgi:hypothetical protein
MAGGSFRQSEWDPKKIVSQIAVMQVYFYLVSTAVWMFIAMLTGRTFSVDTLLSWEVAVRAPPSLPTRAAGTAIPCPPASASHPVCCASSSPSSQVEGAGAEDAEEARGAGGGQQESWVVGMLAALVVASACGAETDPFLSHFAFKTIVLPRQARDKHRNR